MNVVYSYSLVRRNLLSDNLVGKIFRCSLFCEYLSCAKDIVVDGLFSWPGRSNTDFQVTMSNHHEMKQPLLQEKRLMLVVSVSPLSTGNCVRDSV